MPIKLAAAVYVIDLNGACFQGKKSTQDERGVAAKKTVEMDDALNGAAKQVGMWKKYV